MPLFALIITALCLAANSISAAPQDRRAMAGDTLLLKGHVVHVEGIICPKPDLPAGALAKNVAAAYLQRSAVTCSYTPIGDKSFGDCQSKTNAFPSLRKTLLQSKLCTLECSDAAGSKYPCA